MKSHRSFLSEIDAYALLTRAGFTLPRHGLPGKDMLPFREGEPVVLKGLGENLWHKTELGAVRFSEFAPRQLTTEARDMRQRIEAAGHRWLGALICERVEIARNDGLPVEGFVSLTRGEAGWMVLCGFGGLAADALAKLAPPLRWPVAWVTPEQALTEFQEHLLGRIWLGRLRGTRSLTSLKILRAFFESLWRLAKLANRRCLALIEMNPVAPDAHGRLLPLDAVGNWRRTAPCRVPPPRGFLAALQHPKRIALLGVSSKPGGVGRTILENLRRHAFASGDLVVIKPGLAEFHGLPCLPDLKPLKRRPADLLILAVSAPVAVETLEKLIRQGGGANTVAIVAGGIGDGADTAGYGEKLRALLNRTRTAGRWTPAVLGPNFLGHWVPGESLDTSFIPQEKIPPARDGELTLLGQSGAFLLCRRSRQPALRFRLGVALGNQLDVSCGDMLEALATRRRPGPVAAYVEGFLPGQLESIAKAVHRLKQRGARVIIHRGGRTESGQAAAASHTGAMAGSLQLEQALLTRAGAKFSASIAEFDAALTWLGAYPRLKGGPVALLTNAGFESVNGSDLLGEFLPSAMLDARARTALATALARHELAGLVQPKLPLDLTPMADEAAFLDAATILLRRASVLIAGLVPFTQRLATDPAGARKFAAAFATLVRTREKPVGIVIDAGADYNVYRAAFIDAGLPVFDRVELALSGLRVLG
jgi:acyl-CoA synthetase (NDP forming)